jgi:hypothetical protein
MKTMPSTTPLILIKTLHTLIWLFFNVVIFYMLYAVIVNKLDSWLWIGYGLIALEGLVLLLFKGYCPLTVVARRYAAPDRDNFDIYLPNWLARHNKRIYTAIMGVIVVLTVGRVMGF